MALAADHIVALIDLRVAELRLLAARTAVEFWQTRPTLADRYFPIIPSRGAKVVDVPGSRGQRPCQSGFFAA